MTNPKEIHLPPEQAYVRNVAFAVELLDAVTLERVSQGVNVVTDGLQRRATVNASGLFVWLQEDLTSLTKITIEPGALPYERVERTAAQLTPPLTTIELPPRADYSFAAGIAGLRGRLIETRTVAQPSPVANAEIWLGWLDDDVIWRQSTTVCHTSQRGDFVAVLRLSADDEPRLDGNSALSVRLHVKRPAVAERKSLALPLPQGHIADPSTFAQGVQALTFAWDELQP